MVKMLTMILAGGRGKRMDILCHGRAKPALPFAGRFRIIDFTLSNCIHSQIDEVAILADFQRSSLSSYLRQWQLLNASHVHFDILTPKKGSYLGTADAVYQNLDYLRKHDTDTVLILAADHVYKMDYHKMLAFHKQMQADATVGVVSMPIEQAHRFGIVHIDTDRRITDFVEKPKLPQNNLVSMGIYVFDAQILSKRLSEDAEIPSSPHDFGHAIIPKMVKTDKVYAYEFDSYWQDIGTMEAYYEASMELLSQRPPFSLDGKWPIFTQYNNLPPPRKFEQASIENSAVSPGCIIKGSVENSILSTCVCVEEQAVVKNSVVMANTIVGYHSVVESCVLDEGVQVGEFCYIGFGASLIPGTWDFTVVGKDVAIPSYTCIGRNCKVLPHVRHADFRSNFIPSDTIISPISGTRSP
jgi:glucose-1-phosphate adenylyltransferase